MGDGFLAAAAGGPEKQLAFFLNPKIVRVLCHLFLQRRLSSVLVLKAGKFVYLKSRSFVHLFLSRRFSLTISLTRALPLLPVVRPLPMFVALAPLLRLWAEKGMNSFVKKGGVIKKRWHLFLLGAATTALAEDDEHSADDNQQKLNGQ